jgi:heme/copper-type cytochrome/quinol oxidase subunit 4
VNAAIVWFTLMLATLFSWWLGTGHAPGDGTNPALGRTVILAVAFFKLWLILRYFMHVRQAPRGLRRCCDGWVVIAGGSVLAAALWR